MLRGRTYRMETTVQWLKDKDSEVLDPQEPIDVQVSVYGQGIEITGRWYYHLVLERDHEVVTAEFLFKAIRTGDAFIAVNFYQQRIWVGETRLETHAEAEEHVRHQVRTETLGMGDMY